MCMRSKHFSGRPTSQVLAEILPELIASLTFPVHMRWGNYDFKFIRPIRWIVAMHGDEVIPFDIAGVVRAIGQAAIAS